MQNTRVEMTVDICDGVLRIVEVQHPANGLSLCDCGDDWCLGILLAPHDSDIGLKCCCGRGCS